MPKNLQRFFLIWKKNSHSKPNPFKIGEKQIKEQGKILQNLYQFYEEFFKRFSKKVFNSNEVIVHYLKDISQPKLTKE